ncbi:hypothetical protein [Blastococcus sp. PRF04-17]|uniref:hypothetical protein n=1 Tax=Blastococcus sp. PRF04-17 TaxID=2933797 RepID=UPI001FF1C31D|nr:hypothetical protein [Blastococcus sp. PRF04-17]UOY00982.1 hypothetical protein MVA48_18695 [Blastococcus sp. PRF04-17]
MGKHAAPDGASAHPLVVAALASRSGEGAHSHDGRSQGSPGGGSEVGWPAPPAPGGGGLGWPADADADAGDAGTEEPGPPATVVRRGWRRLFGASRVA